MPNLNPSVQRRLNRTISNATSAQEPRGAQGVASRGSNVYAGGRSSPGSIGGSYTRPGQTTANPGNYSRPGSFPTLPNTSQQNPAFMSSASADASNRLGGGGTPTSVNLPTLPPSAVLPRPAVNPASPFVPPINAEEEAYRNSLQTQIGAEETNQSADIADILATFAPVFRELMRQQERGQEELGADFATRGMTFSGQRVASEADLLQRFGLQQGDLESQQGREVSGLQRAVADRISQLLGQMDVSWGRQTDWEAELARQHAEREAERIALEELNAQNFPDAHPGNTIVPSTGLPPVNTTGPTGGAVSDASSRLGSSPLPGISTSAVPATQRRITSRTQPLRIAGSGMHPGGLWGGWR